MQSFSSAGSHICFNEQGYKELNQFLATQNYSTLYILVDSNTHEHCLPSFLQELETELTIEIIEIEPGEEHKSIETCSGVWNALSELHADRKALMINLGGGMVTDLGGFVALTYKRGIDYINVPTSLLAMVDASIGGKTGVDLGKLKNQVGVIQGGKMVLIDTTFLATLPQNELLSGLAEVLKHGLIRDRSYWDNTIATEAFDNEVLNTLIYESVQIKHKVVTEDPEEHGLRKILNFGHTLGHAIESYFLQHPYKKPLLHGEAIAIGMILECYLSTEKLGFPKKDLEQVKHEMSRRFAKVDIEQEEIASIIELMKFDKKNSHGKINFVLLKEIGHPEVDHQVAEDLIYKAFEYYAS